MLRCLLHQFHNTSTGQCDPVRVTAAPFLGHPEPYGSRLSPDRFFREKISKLLSEDQLNSRYYLNSKGHLDPIAKDISMRRHETQVCVALALLFLVSMAVGLHAWL